MRESGPGFPDHPQSAGPLGKEQEDRVRLGVGIKGDGKALWLRAPGFSEPLAGQAGLRGWALVGQTRVQSCAHHAAGS